MRIAVLGDVHGNRFALEAVVQDIEPHRPDAWVNLGDQLFGGADPAGAWALQQELRARHGVLEVRGNTEEGLGETLTETTAKRDMLEWLHGVLPEGTGAYVAALPTSVTLADGTVLAAHGTPDSAWTYLLRDGDGWASDDLVRDRLSDIGPARMVIVGHSHLEHLRQIGPITVVNAGAVSRQKDGSPLARWVLLEGAGDVWSVTFRRVAYDVGAAARWAEKHAYHGTKEAAQLRTGNAAS
ncbi:diadenosine tetraphosphatase ApaH/serine/threonine PP2A family protein phosphatase [Deinococcus metalli]|uniref:Diadenosine tetraphosphatase ApaH/serine/threonine PP2A family protein phosphatase n=1 Tax=Deinococcus metalli TaxID=1141878 RepID=A0A7W8KIS5_9DEIO|nr:metallophosphoesterase family protein [Deinococcus metalli]MBB5378523.1 diadenosine tetraphosphatase ApaH/serine/threonine PP2A family protein phosphatase [Deinococcus metalli]GHF58325.1 metallophosphoesterase [Deinococcus metalli]